MKLKFKLSCQENLGAGSTFAQRCSMLSDFGFEAVEIWGRDLLEKPEQLASYKKTLEQCGLKVSVVVIGYHGCLLDPAPAQRKIAVNDIKELLKISGALNAVGLIIVPVFGGPRITDLSPLETAVELEDRLMISYLKELGPCAQQAGTKLILEPLNRGETHYLNTLDQAAKLIKAANVDGLALMGDLFHMNIEETDICKALERNQDKLAHIHLADNTRLEPGTGMTNFAAVFETLKKTGYPYYVSLECGFSVSDRTEALSKTVNFLKMGK